MVNLGDRAYHVGLHNIIAGHLGHRVMMSPVKAFPYLTAEKTKSIRTHEDASELFGEWWSVVEERNKRSKNQEFQLKRRFEDNFLTRSAWFRKLDDRVRFKLGRGALETISPYLFRDFFASYIVQRIESADLVIFNGGAFIADHLDRYLPMVLFELYIAKELGKPTAVVNQTVSIAKPSNHAMVSYVFSMLDGHWVREPRSRLVLEQMGIPSERIHLSCDAAFGLPFPQLNPSNSGIRPGTVGICVRGDRPVRSDLWANLSRYLIEKLGLELRFFFTSRFQDKKAYDEIRALYTNIDHLDFCDFPQLIEQIKDFEFIITDRYHATIFAILAGTPFITMDSNTFKTRGLMDMVEYPIDVISETADLDLIVRNIDTVLSNRATLVDQLLAARTKLSDYAKRSLESLNSL